jgi:hypothetical protein
MSDPHRLADSLAGKESGVDFDELSEIFDLGPEPEEEDGLGPPDFRATIHDKGLTVINWAPYLLGGGPNGELLRGRAAAGVSIADLWVTESPPHEVIVKYLAVANLRRADRVLTRWAEAVGYFRLWLPDRMVQLDLSRPLGSARVECPNCGATWEDSGPDFWSSVRESGRFPTLCPICNSDLPQWRWRHSRREGKTVRG